MSGLKDVVKVSGASFLSFQTPYNYEHSWRFGALKSAFFNLEIGIFRSGNIWNEVVNRLVFIRVMQTGDISISSGRLSPH